MRSPQSTDIVILDEPEECPYLPGETARLPLRMPVRKLTLSEADIRLAEGNRRTGEFLYQTRCPNCSACEPIRLDCNEFEFSPSQRRILRRGDRQLEIRKGPAIANQQRVDLFNRHRLERGLATKESAIDLKEYEWGFVRTCFSSFEISYWLSDQLAGIAICDHGENSLSAVYTFYDPELSRQSVGTYSILKQIQYCQENSLSHLYLGYYINRSPHMAYKTNFHPNERLLNGHWVKFD
ncbi:MAG: arginyltransferase [Mariniblastus sp.]|nr:arginyltransferase [Mariniblastus sp.]